jgi:hypothetical protein
VALDPFQRVVRMQNVPCASCWADSAGRVVPTPAGGRADYVCRTSAGQTHTAAVFDFAVPQKGFALTVSEPHAP